jgi:predicted patatin/cPLA2 family phospholipase
MVEIDGRKFLDGAMADSIPVRFFESIGYDRNIVILTQPLGYVKKPDKLLPLIKLWYRKYPKLLEAILSRDRHYNETLEYIRRREEAGELLVIRPPQKLPIERTEKDPQVLRQVYEIGRKEAEARIDEIQAFLHKTV